MHEIYFTVQRYNFGYYSDQYGVMASDTPIKNFEDYNLQPIYVSHLRFPEFYQNKQASRSRTQFFIADESPVDLVEWIAESIGEERRFREEGVTLLVDPVTEPALSSDFNLLCRQLGKVNVEIGDRSNKKHTAIFRQCQKPLETTSFTFEADDIKAFEHEPLGLTLTQLNRNYYSGFGPLLLKGCKSQIDTGNTALIVKSVKAEHVDINYKLVWDRAKAIESNYGCFIRHGSIIIKEELVEPDHGFGGADEEATHNEEFAPLTFGSMDVPNSATERVAEHFNIDNDHAQEVVAQMLGHNSWAEFAELTAADHVSAAPDEFATEKEQDGRVDYQAKVLGRFLPFTEPVLRRKALALRVSAIDSKSEQLAFDGYRRNTLLRWQFNAEPIEWRFMPSERSYEVRESLYDLGDSWQQQRLNFGEYENQIVQILQKQPENLAAYLYLFTAIEDINHWALAGQYIGAFEEAVDNTIPSDYPRKRKSDLMIWGTIENRDFLRAVYYLAVGFYALKDYRKANAWFLFLTRCVNQAIGLEKAFLADLREDQPSGDVHFRHDKY